MIKVTISDDSINKKGDGALYKVIIQAIEKPLLENTLERTFGNQLKAARILGINRKPSKKSWGESMLSIIRISETRLL